MFLNFRYRGSSSVRGGARRRTIALCSELGRDPVAFDGAFADPLPFREAISALHAVVLDDLRFKPRSREAYKAWRREQDRQRGARRRALILAADAELQDVRDQPLPAELKLRHEADRKRYWRLRDAYGRRLMWHDRELWRRLMPLDPVVTVAEDALLFEAFSADETSYACLSVSREAFGSVRAATPGTTNVDYSQALFEHLQGLRSYRETRFLVDPEGIEVAFAEGAELREETIDLPEGWLDGFRRLQLAMGRVAHTVELDRPTLNSLLALLKRRRAKESPRHIGFELRDGRSPKLVIAPWMTAIESRGTTWRGPDLDLRVWGRRRLLTLARALPLIQRVRVHLLGDGRPSFWELDLGPMTLILGLTSWTRHSWSQGDGRRRRPQPDASEPALDEAPEAPATTVAAIAEMVEARGRLTLDEVATMAKLARPSAEAALLRLAHEGLVIADLAAGAYRWRPVLPPSAVRLEA